MCFHTCTPTPTSITTPITTPLVFGSVLIMISVLGPPPPGAPPLSAGVDRDEVDLIVAELTSAPRWVWPHHLIPPLTPLPLSSKLRCLALQSLLTFCREYPNKCSWDKNFRPTMKGLIGQLEDEEPPTRTMALRVIREILKTQSTRMGEFAEPLTLKVLLSFAHNDTSVSTYPVAVVTDS